uniref:hypothetical protein n=1 Tax=Fulvivirga sp. TaxID=1931237 RepID=UPI00404B838F
MKDDLNKQIEKWLDTQGYNLEMLCARTFREFGFTVAQSVYYFDTDNNQTREIDLVCYYSKTIQDVRFHLTFVVECKKSNDKPWLVFKSMNTFKGFSGYDNIEATANGLILLNEIENTKSKRKKAVIDFLEFDKISLGHGVTQAFTSGVDNTYAATTSVSKSIKYFVDKYKKSKVKLCSLYFPVIVIDGRLFDVELQKSNETKIEEVTQSKLLQIRSDLNKTNITHITTKDNIIDFCRERKANCEKFFKIYSKQIRKIADNNPYSDTMSNLN